jgi:hypothetical protein
MSASYRSQANLHLGYANRFLRNAGRGAEGEDDWGGNYAHAMLLSAVLHLQLAYRSHLCDLFAQRQLEFPHGRAGEALAADPELAGKVPELSELAEREEQDAWLRELLDFPFIRRPASVSRGSMHSLAVATGGDEPDVESLGEALQRLQEVVSRHRDGMQEY